MDPQHPEATPNEPGPPSIPLARPAETGPNLPIARPVQAPSGQPNDLDASARWWAPKPISRPQAFGDILIVGAVLVGPQAASMLIGASVHTAAQMPSAGRIVVANALIWATVSAVAVYLTWRSGQPLSSIGLRWGNPIGAIGAAIAATIAIYAALLLTAIPVAILSGASRETMTTPVREIGELLGRPSWLTIFGIAATAGLFEEIVFRGFILTRLRVLLGGWTMAIAVGSLLFALPHIWEGRWAVMLILPVAVVLSITFVLRRSVAAPILAHFLFNFLQLATLRVMQDSPQWQEMLK